MGLRNLARTVSKNKSYRKSRSNSMFPYFFSKEWREKGHYANLRKDTLPGPTKKGHKPFCPSGKEF